MLIDRLWPRGVSRQQAKLDDWDKELPPSTELRRWFAHEPSRFEEFRRRYIEELRDERPRLTALRRRARGGTLTLVYSAHDRRAQRRRRTRGRVATRPAQASTLDRAAREGDGWREHDTSGRSGAPDRFAVERWIDEGGHVPPEAVIEWESAAGDDGLVGVDRQRGQTVGPAERR